MKKWMNLVLTGVIVAAAGVSIYGCGQKESPVTPETEESQVTPETEESSDTPETQEKYRIGICAGQVDNLWAAKGQEILQEECKKDTDQFEVVVNTASDAADQQNILESYLLDDFDLIMFAPMDSSLTAEICNKVYESGVPLFVYERAMAEDNYTCFTSNDGYGNGVAAAEYLGEVLGGKGDVAVLRCWVGIEEDRIRYEGFVDTITEKYPDINIVREGDGQNSIEKGYEVMSNILAAVDHIDAVYAQVDESGIGAEQAIRNAKRTDIKYIVGVGGSQEVFDMIKEDDAIYTACTSFFPDIAAKALQQAKNYLLTGECEKEIIFPCICITKDNVDEYYDVVPQFTRFRKER